MNSRRCCCATSLTGNSFDSTTTDRDHGAVSPAPRRGQYDPDRDARAADRREVPARDPDLRRQDRRRWRGIQKSSRTNWGGVAPTRASRCWSRAAGSAVAKHSAMSKSGSRWSGTEMISSACCSPVDPWYVLPPASILPCRGTDVKRRTIRWMADDARGEGRRSRARVQQLAVTRVLEEKHLARCSRPA